MIYLRKVVRMGNYIGKHFLCGIYFFVNVDKISNWDERGETLVYIG